MLNNLFLSAATATVLVGTLYPLFYEAVTGAKITVGPPFFNLAMLPLTVPLLLAVPFGPFLAWKRGDLLGVAQRLVAAAAIALVMGVLTLALMGEPAPLAPLGVALGAFMIAGSLAEPLWRARAGRVPARETLRRLANLPRAAWGGTLGHLGIGVTVLGVVLVTALGTERVVEMRPGETLEVGRDVLRYDDVRGQLGPNFRQDVATFAVLRGDAVRATLRPARRFYDARQQPTTEAAISTRGASQLYLAIGAIDPQTRVTVVRVWEKPFVILIWLGSLVMAAGGALSLTDRRLRVGVPMKARSASDGREKPALPPMGGAVGEAAE